MHIGLGEGMLKLQKMTQVGPFWPGY